MNDETDITGRDSYIVAKALGYAMLAIEQLPAHCQETSDATDMRKIFEAQFSEALRTKVTHDAMVHLLMRNHSELREHAVA